MTGKLYGVGLGPGDPELVTVKAARLIKEADVVAFHSARHGRSVAKTIAQPYFRDDQIMEQLVYPVTTEDTDDYQGEIDAFYEEAAAKLAAHLDAGRNVVVLAAGDPFFYGSYMHMHKRLKDRYEWEVVPGVTSVSGASAVLGTPLVERDEVLTILPGTLPPAELATRLADTDSAAILKLGRTFGNVKQALEEAGRLDNAWYVERATTGRQKTSKLADVDPDTVPYFSLALLPSHSKPTPKKGEVVVVGLGPGARTWLTPEARQELEAADELVGYTTYLNRVPDRPGQTKHASHNQVESERAAFALDLARKGKRVAVGRAAQGAAGQGADDDGARVDSLRLVEQTAIVEPWRAGRHRPAGAGIERVVDDLDSIEELRVDGAQQCRRRFIARGFNAEDYLHAGFP